MALSCSNCGKELPDNAKFCGDCGTFVEVQEKKPDYCANCFAELAEGVQFCMQCGKPAVIAQSNYPRPEGNKAIFEELQTSSPQQVKYRNRKAIYEATGEYPMTDEKIEDFEQNRARIADRAIKWAEYTSSDLVERIHWFQEFKFSSDISWDIGTDFGMENRWFPTNKPNHHKALFYEEFINYYLHRLQQHRVLTYDDPPQPTPLFFDYLRKVEGWTDEDTKKFKYKPPDMEEIRGWANKDDELFPPPQPLRVEVANAIMNFTTDEGALVVYVDCTHKGKTVEIDKFAESSIWFDYPDRVAEIRERTIDNSVVCAAIFNHIPFVNNDLRHHQQVLTQMDCTLRATPARFEDRWEETVTLFRGHVTELDWRGRKV